MKIYPDDTIWLENGLPGIAISGIEGNYVTVLWHTMKTTKVHISDIMYSERCVHEGLTAPLLWK